MVNWKKGAGNISIVQTPSGEGIGLTGMQLAKYMNFDAFPTSTTTNSKGTSITRQSNATKNSKHLSGKELGHDYEIYKTPDWSLLDYKQKEDAIDNTEISSKKMTLTL